MRLGKILAATLCLFFLSACNNNNTTHNPAPPSPIPQPIPEQPQSAIRPGRLRFKADWSKQSIGLTGFVEEDEPGTVHHDSDNETYHFPGIPDDYDNAIYLTFPREGGEGLDCVDPQPNKFLRTENNKLYIHADPAFPIITKELYSVDPGVTISAQAEISAKANTLKAWGGLVIYRREGYWRGIYYSADASGGHAGQVEIGLWGPTRLKMLGRWVPEHESHVFRIDYKDGEWKYFVDGELVFTETPENRLTADSQDPTFLKPTAPPHLALFMGHIDMVVGEMDMWSDAP